MATYLETRKDIVDRVLYPGLKSHPQYELAQSQTTGNGGVITFFLKNGTAADSRKFVKNLKIFLLATSLGGVESLALIPALMTFKAVS